MFQQTLARRDDWKVGSWSLAAGFHAAVIVAIIAGSLFALKPIHEPDIPEVIILQLEPPPPKLESAPIAAAPSRRGGRDEQAITPPRPVQPRPPAKPPVHSEPTVTPPTLEALPEEPAPERVGSGAAPGIPGGTGDGNGAGPGSGSGDGFGPGFGDGTGGPLAVGGEVIPPHLLVKLTPEYPEVARRARLEGRVSLTVVVGPDGTVESVEVVRATSAVFSAPAIEAVKRWRYTPASWRGRPVRVFYSVEVMFVLR